MDFPDEYASSEHDDNSDDDDDVIVVDDTPKLLTKDTQRKVAAAVEKGMDNNQLVPYFNRYILLMRDQQQRKQTFSEEQLHNFIADNFHSLEYKNDQSDGKQKEYFVDLYYSFGIIYLRSINFFYLSNLL